MGTSVKTKKAEKEDVKSVVKIDIHEPIFINTPHGATTVYGHELVAKKDLIILAHCLTLSEFAEVDHGVRVVMFRDDWRPKKLMASCIPDINGIAINLMATFENATEESIDCQEISVRAAFHRNLIINYLHEIHHMSLIHVDGMPTSKIEISELEELAEEWSLEKLYELAKTKDIEPAHPSESSFLSNELLVAMSGGPKDPWNQQQTYMLENNIMYQLKETDDNPELTLMSFKGLIHLMSGDDPESKEWAKDTTTAAELEEKLKEAEGMITDPAAPAPVPVPTTVPVPTDAPAAADPNTFMDAEDVFYDSYEEAEAQYTAPAAVPATVPAAPTLPAAPAPMAPAAPAPAIPPVAPGYNQPPAPATIPGAQADQTGPAVVSLPQTGLNAEETKNVVFGVFNKIYSHVFTNCGRLLNSDAGFSNPEAVMAMPIPLTPEEQSVVVKMDCLDENGRWCPGMVTTNGIRGYLSKGKLPFYKLYINAGGVEAGRLLMPQNPGKKNGGEYSKPALSARAGSCIMYVKDVATDKFTFKCVDSAWQA